MSIPGDKQFTGNIQVSGDLTVDKQAQSLETVVGSTLVSSVASFGLGQNYLYYSDDLAQDSHWIVPTAQVKGAVAYDSTNDTYTNETAAANDSAANDMTLLPASPAEGDAYYFCFDQPVRVMRLNVGTAGAGTWTLTWEYWNGSAWTALSDVSDGTNGFQTAGSNEISWTVSEDWDTTTVSSIVGYWVRARLSSFTSMTTQPLGTQAWAIAADVEADASTAPNLTTTADAINGRDLTGETAYITQTVDLGADADGKTYCFSIWLKNDDASEVKLAISDAVGTTLKTISPTSAWRRFYVARTCPTGAGSSLTVKLGLRAGTMYAWRAGLEENPVPRAAVHTDSSNQPTLQAYGQELHTGAAPTFARLYLTTGVIQSSLTYYVSPDGTGSGLTQDDPCSLDYALTHLADHTILYLADGTYHVSTSYNIFRKFVRFIGNSSDYSLVTIIFDTYDDGSYNKSRALRAYDGSDLAFYYLTLENATKSDPALPWTVGGGECVPLVLGDSWKTSGQLLIHSCIINQTRNYFISAKHCSAGVVLASVTANLSEDATALVITDSGFLHLPIYNSTITSGYYWYNGDTLRYAVTNATSNIPDAKLYVNLEVTGRGLFTEGVRVREDVGDYGGNFTNYTPPTGYSGLIILAADTNTTNPGQRLYAYVNGEWRYVDLT